MMKIETLLTLAALGAAAALLWPKDKPATTAQGYSGGPYFGGSAGSLWSPDVLTYLKPQAPKLGVLF